MSGTNRSVTLAQIFPTSFTSSLRAVMTAGGIYRLQLHVNSFFSTSGAGAQTWRSTMNMGIDWRGERVSEGEKNREGGRGETGGGGGESERGRGGGYFTS